MGLFDIKREFLDFKPDRNFLQLFIEYILQYCTIFSAVEHVCMLTGFCLIVDV